MTERIRKLTTSPQFTHFIVWMILLAGVLTGLETYPAFDSRTPLGYALDLAQNMILAIFVVEITLKILACGSRPWEYFRQGWNVFDFVVVAACLLPFGAQYAAVLRLARILRTMRMVSVLPRLQVLVGALLKSIPSLGYVGVLLGLHFYVYSVVGTFLFRANDPLRFGSLQETALTLFQVLTLEGWNDVLATQYHGSDTHYDDSWKTITEGRRTSEAQPLVASAYFVTFILLGTMIMLNLFTGVIIGSMEEARDETKEEARKGRLEQHGFLTLRDELALVGGQLQEIAERLHALESVEGTDQPRPAKTAEA